MLQAPCRDCPPDSKRQANYPDESGRSKQLCAKCARAAGTYMLQTPCVECPPDAKLQAGLGLGRIVALYCRSPTLYRNRYHSRCLSF